MCTPSSTPQSESAAYQCYPLLSRFEYIDRQTCPVTSWAGHFSPSKLPLHVWGSGPPSKTEESTAIKYCKNVDQEVLQHSRCVCILNLDPEKSNFCLHSKLLIFFLYGPTRVYIPNGISIGSAVFARLTVRQDRPTDRPR